MRKALSTVAALAFAGLLAGAPARAAEEVHIPSQDWSFAGLFGSFDTAAQQRGLQVYTEVCSGCHGLSLVAFRNIEDFGYGEEEIKAFAAGFSVVDGPDDDGEMFDRDGIPSDYFPSPFANDKAAAAANNGAIPPDLSLVAKSRKGGPDYIYALLTGYEEPPADFEMLEGLSYNTAFPGHQISMASPLFDDGVTYADGTPATAEQMAHDVATFLMWAAEPDLVNRKRTGIKVMLFLIVFTGLLYATKRKVWSDLH
jgi:ubiquinol-cytochrome c reductase cytochrome c1 subunit